MEFSGLCRIVLAYDKYARASTHMGFVPPVRRTFTGARTTLIKGMSRTACPMSAAGVIEAACRSTMQMDQSQSWRGGTLKIAHEIVPSSAQRAHEYGGQLRCGYG